MKRSLIVLALPLVLAVGCSTATKKEGLQRHAYATQSDRRTFENEFPQVWKAVEAAVDGMPVAKRDVGKATEHTLETEWVVDESREKYYRYQVNGSPRQKKLKSRFKYVITAQSVVGGTEVRIKTTEEIERLKKDGTSDGFSSVDPREVDTSRQGELLDRIGATLLTASSG